MCICYFFILFFYFFFFYFFFFFFFFFFNDTATTEIYTLSLHDALPTHQPVEQLASFRAMPGLITIRPADANEVVEAWRVIMQLRHQPVLLVLSRQALPTYDRGVYGPAAGLAQGAYVLAD